MQSLSTVYSWLNTQPWSLIGKVNHTGAEEWTLPSVLPRLQGTELGKAPGPLVSWLTAPFPKPSPSTASFKLRVASCFAVLTPQGGDTHQIKYKSLGTGWCAVFCRILGALSNDYVFITYWKWKICGKRNSQPGFKQDSWQVIRGGKNAKKAYIE